MAELVDALGLGSSGFMPWRFKSSYRHSLYNNAMNTEKVQLGNGYSGSYTNIFPTTIGKFQADKSIWEPIHDKTRDVIYKHKKFVEDKNLVNRGDHDWKFDAEKHGVTSYYGPSIMELPHFTPFSSYLRRSLDHYFSSICDYEYPGMILNQAWFTVYPPGHFIPRHSHPATQMSGVYYFDVPEDGGDLVFEDPIGDFRVWYDDGQNPAGPFRPVTAMNVKPEPGMFVLFPSWLPHRTMPNKGNSDRIIFSFNFILKV